MQTGNDRHISRQVRRAEERRAAQHGQEVSSQPPPERWWEVVYAGALLTASVGLFLIAAASDENALKAAVNLGWYCWLILCAVCAVGIFLTFLARWKGLTVPLYFRAALWIGAACGVLTFSKAWHVITETKAEAQPAPKAAHLDMRNRVIYDTSFADRNLRGSNFSNAMLERVDLSGADLSESDLREATFHKVDLSGADLCGVDLRGADLRGARGLRGVKDWSYVFYNDQTKLPGPVSYILSTLPGPIPDDGHDLLYMCKANVVRRLHG